ncbi:aminoglycoside 3'-phosphotransferase [Nocardiopsis ansamitocini]|uniref:Phosphotransferase n=1 Tax=Nocardiopsis ansamitocini TaxID=1670832 RepID=A0A9W6P7J3_9ACTN|nr:aminoglycoside 3'-phosphotransferase [Nocardiopsis ansamitocini]GLU48443.1 putative phosphotransferase [Nocardiopsis ansamitocini]
MRASGPPPAGTAVPTAVAALAGTALLRVVWRNEAGGLTFAAGTPSARRFIKWAPAGSGLDLRAEALRLAWASHHTRVPPVLGQGSTAAGEWLVTRAVAGENAVTARWKAAPERAVRGVALGLRALHETLPVGDCPFSWSVVDRVRAARAHGVLTAAASAELLAGAPPVTDPVVCHGDPCMPNTLLDGNGDWSAHVDLGSLGIADRWADIAVAVHNTRLNYGPGWEQAFLDAYGIDHDSERASYYLELWQHT